jgi:uncharacterized zinc-type alcohol dehydrogenase-like protein
VIQAYAVHTARGRLRRIEHDPGALGSGQVELDVIARGVCRCDLSMIENESGDSDYPLAPGHEIAGRIARVGANAAPVSGPAPLVAKRLRPRPVNE